MKPKPLRTLFDATHHGKYSFEEFLDCVEPNSFEPKKIGGRDIYQPSKKLKAFHAFLNTFLFAYLEINERVVFSYRKGFNAQSAISRHAQNRAFFQADFKNFFGSISRDTVKTTIQLRSHHCPIADLNLYVERILDLTTANDALPIGFSTSPLISNACLTAFDHELDAHCTKLGAIYTRYADDLVVSAQERELLLEISTTVENLLQRHFEGRMVLNPSKSKLTTIGRKVKALGLVILPTGRVTIDMELKKKIEVLLHFYSTDTPKFVRFAGCSDYEGAVGKVSGYLNYVNANDQRYLEKLRGKFGATIVDSFIHKTVS